ncbi:MAG: cysteine desulfurase [Ignavibacteria bacterium]|nr:cysteine desulfurase [Ignavibacteria bacterium]
MKFPIYLDNNSTTQVDPRVLEEMLPFFSERFGNSASKQHSFGWIAESAIDRARQRIASLLNANPEEIFFTSGATESNNLAILGIAQAYQSKGNHIVTSSIEHPSVLEPCKSLGDRGFKISYVRVDESGKVNLKDLKGLINSKTILVSIMASNNEIGTIQPVDEIAKICNAKNVLFHTDAVQSLGKVSLDAQKIQADLISISAHKIYGPKGIGALFIRKRKPSIQLKPIIHGGGHEKGLRSGTLNVPCVVGFGKVCEIALNEMENETSKIKLMQNRLFDFLLSGIEDVSLNGHEIDRLPGNLNFKFKDVNADLLLAEIKDVAFSSGSACSSAKAEPSHVLKAIGLAKNEIQNSIRLSIGRFNTEDEIEYVGKRFTETVKRIRDKIAID